MPAPRPPSHPGLGFADYLIALGARARRGPRPARGAPARSASSCRGSGREPASTRVAFTYATPCHRRAGLAARDRRRCALPDLLTRRHLVPHRCRARRQRLARPGRHRRRGRGPGGDHRDLARFGQFLIDQAADRRRRAGSRRGDRVDARRRRSRGVPAGPLRLPQRVHLPRPVVAAGERRHARCRRGASTVSCCGSTPTPSWWWPPTPAAPSPTASSATSSRTRCAGRSPPPPPPGPPPEACAPGSGDGYVRGAGGLKESLQHLVEL